MRFTADPDSEIIPIEDFDCVMCTPFDGDGYYGGIDYYDDELNIYSGRIITKEFALVKGYTHIHWFSK